MTRSLLRQREFRLLFGAQAVSVFGDRMVTVALAFAVLELGGSASAIGLVLASHTLPLVGCLLVGGVVADRASRRAVMVAADLVRFASQGAIAALLIGGAAELWLLASLSGISGAATGFFSPASTGLLPLVVAPERLQQANGLRATAMASGEIAGPLAAGVLVAAAGAGWALAIDAATFAVSAALLVRLRVPERAGRAAASFAADLREGWSEFRSRTWVWSIVASVAFMNMLWGSLAVLGPVVAERDLGGAAGWGTVLAAMGAGGLAGGALSIRLRPRRPLLAFVLVGTLLVVPQALLALGVPLAALALGAFVSGSALFFGNAVWESTLQRHIPADSLSRVSAYDWFGSLAFAPLGLAIWGPLSELAGIDASLWLAFGLHMALTAALLCVRDVRRLPPDP